MIPIKITIDHNNDTVSISPLEFSIDTQMTKFVRVSNILVFEKILYEVLNMMSPNGTELEIIDEDRMKSENW